MFEEVLNFVVSWSGVIWIPLILVVLFFMGIKTIRPTEKGLIERWGRFLKQAEPGFHWIIPIIDNMIYVNMTECMVDIKPQRVITKDDLNALVDAQVYFRVLNPQKAVYNADNYWRQITNLASTTLRDIIGKMTLTEANSKRNELNAILEKELDKNTNDWGIDIVRVELQRIEPPEDVQQAMNNVVIAERDKKAAVDFATAEETKADGYKRAAIKKAEGEKQAVVLSADGQREAMRKIAEGKAKAIELEYTAAQKYFKGEAQILKKLEVTENTLKKNTKFVVPDNQSLVMMLDQQAGIVPIKERKK